MKFPTTQKLTEKMTTTVVTSSIKMTSAKKIKIPKQHRIIIKIRMIKKRIQYEETVNFGNKHPN